MNMVPSWHFFQMALGFTWMDTWSCRIPHTGVQKVNKCEVLLHDVKVGVGCTLNARSIMGPAFYTEGVTSEIHKAGTASGPVHYTPWCCCSFTITATDQVRVGGNQHSDCAEWKGCALACPPYSLPVYEWTEGVFSSLWNAPMELGGGL